MSTQPIITSNSKDSKDSSEHPTGDVPTVFDVASDIQQSLQDLLRKVNEDDAVFNKSVNSIYDKLKKMEE